MKYTVDRDTCELSCEIRGEGQPLLLIHGVACDSSFYEKAAELLKDTFRVITYDRRGYADSKASSDACFSVKAQAEDAMMVLEGAGVSLAQVVGCSAGGIIALEMAYRYPDKVEKLFLHEPPMGMKSFYREEIRRWMNLLELDSKKKSPARTLLDFVFGIGGVDPSAESTTLEYQRKNLENLKIFLHYELKDFLTYHEQLSKERRLEMPCVLAAGTEDEGGIFSLAAPSSAEWLGCPFLRVPGYHNLASERPEVFADILKEVMK